MLGTSAWIALIVTGLVFAGLQLRRRLPVDLMFIGALVVVTVTGVITPEQALKNFSNPAVITIAALLIVASGLRATGVLDWLGDALLGKVDHERPALLRLALALVTTSAFLLNTALVAMTVPVVVDWCRRRNISPSRLLIPVSYFAILGGVCSLIGTSTTLIVNGLLRDQAGETRVVLDESNPLREAKTGELARYNQDPSRYRTFAADSRPLRLFEIGKAGLPCAAVGTLVMVLAAPYLLPKRADVADQFDQNRREYLAALRVQPECKLVGQSVSSAGFDRLPGLFLIEIIRGDHTVSRIGPNHVIQADDQLVFSGIVSTIVELEKIPGLMPESQAPKLSQLGRRGMAEAVVSRTSPLVGHKLGSGEIWRRYKASVVAVHRTGERLTNKVEDISVEVGDTLLLHTGAEFIPAFRNSRDFYLVSQVDGYQRPRHKRATWAASLGLLLITLLILVTLEPVHQLVPALSDSGVPAIVAIAVACAMILARCVDISEARASLDMQVLLAIVGALGLGEALWRSGAAEGIASLLVNIVGDQPYLLLIVVYLLAMVFTELITNNAVASILLPLAIGIAWQGGYNPRPFIMAIAMASSLSFLTPVGYQTNLMVMGPGGYIARDYLKIGIPVAISVSATALLLIPRIWPF